MASRSYLGSRNDIAVRVELPSREPAAGRKALDGEPVIEMDGRLAFDALQLRPHPAESRIRKLSNETPASRLVGWAKFLWKELPAGGEPWALRRIPNGRGRHLEKFVRRHPAADRGTTATA